jgi:probable F420-dependent oxidoreductase
MPVSDFEPAGREIPMRVGYFSTNTAAGINPGVLAKELEDRGFESMWLPEHSHIPVDRVPVPGLGDSVPDAYVHIMDPYVSLALAAGATTSLVLGTGVSMVLEHDILDLACRVATLDVLSGGRMRLGVAVGWIREELRNHRPDIPWSARYEAVSERVAALRLLWAEEAAGFEGHWHNFTTSWLYPKPVGGSVPIGYGYSGSRGLRIAAREADEWMPIDLDVAETAGSLDEAIRRFRQRAAEAGRDPEGIPITLFCWGWAPGDPPIDRLRAYEDLGVYRVVVPPPTMERHNAEVTLRRLDEYSALLRS